MRTWVKPLLLVLVTLPIIGYVTGTLSTAPAEPAPRSPVIMRDADRPEPVAPLVPRRQEPRESRSGGDDGGTDDEVRVVKPTPVRVDDDGAPDDDGDNDGDDDADDDDTTGSGDD